MLVLACAVAGASAQLDEGFAAMYNLDFEGAHSAFGEWEKAHPRDPMGPVSDAAAVLFSEFARMHVLESEFFTNDRNFSSDRGRLQPDPAARRRFEADLAGAHQLAEAVLKLNADDRNALLASVLAQGLHADYLALIEKRDIAALTEMKQSRATAEHLLSLYPDCYDANLAVGVENYMLSLKPAALRWVLRLGGAQTDKQSGIGQLRVTAEKGHYLLPYARLLLAVADLRDGNPEAARAKLAWLAAKYPGNPLYLAELKKLR